MKRLLLFTAIFALSAVAFSQKNVYDFKVKKADGREITLSEYKGKVLLIVNTATECGFTPQYTELQNLYSEYQAKGFEVLDFPCNQFGGQAPGDIFEIQEFCSLNYHTTFPLFDKVEVNGNGAVPLFTYLKAKQGFQGFDLSNPIGKYLDDAMRKQDPNYDKSSDIKWNFTKFLINKKGKVIKRYEPTTGADIIRKDLEKLLK